jgi:hypothetical protein
LAHLLSSRAAVKAVQTSTAQQLGQVVQAVLVVVVTDVTAQLVLQLLVKVTQVVLAALTLAIIQEQVAVVQEQ